MSNLVRSSGEKIIISVGRVDWKPIIANALVNRQLIKDRDIGDIVGLPAEDYVKAKFIRGQPLDLKLVVFFFSVKEPPFKQQGKNYFVRTRCTIPDVRRDALDWSIIKTACGGDNGYLWGRFRATANLSNGRKMAVYGSSEESAQNTLKALAKLSTAKITTMLVSEEKKEGLRDENKALYKQNTRVYPAYFSVINEEKIVGESLLEQSLTGTLIGNFKRKTTPKIPMWITKEPANAKALIIEALKNKAKNQGNSG